MMTEAAEMMPSSESHMAFLGHELISRGDLAEVVAVSKAHADAGASARIAIYEDLSGRVRDIDFSGTLEEVLTRLTTESDMSPVLPKRRGRPKLGVVSREVSLLPRHWSWLADQRGGASASLRRLIESAQKNESGEAIARRAVDAAHRFLWDIAGNQPNFEEATRHLFALRIDEFEKLIAGWPAGLCDQLSRYIERMRAGLTVCSA